MSLDMGSLREWLKRFVYKRFTPALQRAGGLNSSWPRWNHSFATTLPHGHMVWPCDYL